jgi:hypothetical protein
MTSQRQRTNPTSTILSNTGHNETHRGETPVAAVVSGEEGARLDQGLRHLIQRQQLGRLVQVRSLVTQLVEHLVDGEERKNQDRTIGRIQRSGYVVSPMVCMPDGLRVHHGAMHGTNAEDPTWHIADTWKLKADEEDHVSSHALNRGTQSKHPSCPITKARRDTPPAQAPWPRAWSCRRPGPHR